MKLFVITGEATDTLSLPKVAQPEKPIKKNHMKAALSCMRAWIRIWNSAGKEDLNRKHAVVMKTANLGSRGKWVKSHQWAGSPGFVFYILKPYISVQNHRIIKCVEC